MIRKLDHSKTMPRVFERNNHSRREKCFGNPWEEWKDTEIN